MIFELVAVIIVIFIALSVAKSAATNETTAKINVAQDLQMMVDALIGIPDNALVEYPVGVSDYIILLNMEAVTVMRPEDPDFKRVVKNFILPEGYSAEGIVEQKPKICLKKEEKRIVVLEC